jgi:hypothetical protein
VSIGLREGSGRRLDANLLHTEHSAGQLQDILRPRPLGIRVYHVLGPHDAVRLACGTQATRSGCLSCHCVRMSRGRGRY